MSRSWLPVFCCLPAYFTPWFIYRIVVFCNIFFLDTMIWTFFSKFVSEFYFCRENRLGGSFWKCRYGKTQSLWNRTAQTYNLEAGALSIPKLSLGKRWKPLISDKTPNTARFLPLIFDSKEFIKFIFCIWKFKCLEADEKRFCALLLFTGDQLCAAQQ